MFQILDFYADWCGPCQAMKPVFQQLEKEYSGKVSFKKVDVEVEGQLAGQFGIQNIPTFVLTKDGKEVSRRAGATSKDSMKSWIDSNLK